MNKAKKNIVIVGFSQEERNSLALPYIENNEIHFVNTMSEAIKYQGYLLIYDNKDNIYLTDFDRKYRKSLNKFEKIWLYHSSYTYKYEKWSRIEKIDRNIFNDVSFSLSEEWEEYKKYKNNLNNEIHFNNNKLEKINILYQYLKQYKTIKTNQIVNDLGINKRSIERYMLDLNNYIILLVMIISKMNGILFGS